MPRQLHNGSEVHAGLQEFCDERGAELMQKPMLTFVPLDTGIALTAGQMKLVRNRLD